MRAEGREPLMQGCKEEVGSHMAWASNEGASVNELSFLEDGPAFS